MKISFLRCAVLASLMADPRLPSPAPHSGGTLPLNLFYAQALSPREEFFENSEGEAFELRRLARDLEQPEPPVYPPIAAYWNTVRSEEQELFPLPQKADLVFTIQAPKTKQNPEGKSVSAALVAQFSITLGRWQVFVMPEPDMVAKYPELKALAGLRPGGLFLPGSLGVLAVEFRRDVEGRLILFIDEVQPSLGYRALRHGSRKKLDEWRRDGVLKLAQWAHSQGMLVYARHAMTIHHNHPRLIASELEKNYTEPYSGENWREATIDWQDARYIDPGFLNPWFEYLGNADVPDLHKTYAPSFHFDRRTYIKRSLPEHSA